jgi:galactokinase
VNLIGEHVDYCGGAVLPMPLQFGTRVELAQTSTGCIRVFSTRFADTLEMLARRGTILGGADVYVDSDVPASGLSSSASFTVALMTAFSHAAGDPLQGMGLAHTCRRVEHAWAGVQCGIMDQAVVVLGAAGAALYFDCATEEARQIPLPEPHPSIVVIDTGKERSLAASAYNQRLAETRRAAAALGVEAERLARVMPERLQRVTVDALAKRRASHVIAEHARVHATVAAIERGDWRTAGHLFTRSHDSLRSLYEVSCPELDALVDLACGCSGVEGARMTGAGFGGAIVALVWPDAVADTLDTVTQGYAARFGTRPTAFVAVSPGGVVELQ